MFRLFLYESNWRCLISVRLRPPLTDIFEDVRSGRPELRARSEQFAGVPVVVQTVDLLAVGFEVPPQNVVRIGGCGHTVGPDLSHDVQYLALGFGIDIDRRAEADLRAGHEPPLEIGKQDSPAPFGGLRSLVGILHRLYDTLVEGRRVGVENRRGVSDGTAYQLFIDHGFLRHGMQSVLCE